MISLEEAAHVMFHSICKDPLAINPNAEAPHEEVIAKFHSLSVREILCE